MKQCAIPNCNKDITDIKNYGMYIDDKGIEVCPRHALIYQEITKSYLSKIELLLKGDMN